MKKDEEYQKYIMKQEICNTLVECTAKFSECGLCTGDVRNKCFVKSGITKGKYIRMKEANEA